MVSRYDFIKDLNPTKEDWRIKVKVVRSWQVPNFQRKGLDDNVEMVLLDERGGRIHATVKGTLQVRKKSRMEKSIVQPNFPANVFDFVDYDLIEKESSDSPYLVDVIGLLSGVGEVCEHLVSGRKTKMIVLELDNLRGHKLECTLWEHYVDEVQIFLASNDTPHKVMIVQLGRIKGFRGKIGVTNTKYTTKIIMDSNLPEIVEFKKCLSSDGVESSLRLTQLSTQSSYSYESDFLKETDRKSISDIKLCSEVTTCITYGTIKSIESRYNWWYWSCNRCPFSVCEDFEKWYYLVFKSELWITRILLLFLLFDQDCVTLLGMSVAELRELHFKRGADAEEYPEQLNVLNEKSMLFKINVKEKNLNAYSEPKYQVSKICISEEIITAFLNDLVDPNVRCPTVHMRFDAEAYTNSQ
ncbi:uncharacterized protein LOC133287407 [Gastrolobium bilobum]|uniref:uncharacterized protein LOC133287407 n=1 Tax=Gastrolobium bilobum TaxID=150636 RepID=UPI002AB26876|nr:uncharacterized protein LOC133287407 [Gastrolobium bilobum]